jgi:hypothetical protein
LAAAFDDGDATAGQKTVAKDHGAGARVYTLAASCSKILNEAAAVDARAWRTKKTHPARSLHGRGADAAFPERRTIDGGFQQGGLTRDSLLFHLMALWDLEMRIVLETRNAQQLVELDNESLVLSTSRCATSRRRAGEEQQE